MKARRGRTDNTFTWRWIADLPVSSAIAMQSQQRPRFDGYDISHNVYYVLARLARATVARARPALQAPPSYGRPNTVLSAANLGQLARQLVAIDALSYVQSQ